MNRIAGRTVLITGATSGIGEACARRFAAEGAKLILTGRRTEILAALSAELEREHEVEVRTSRLDVRDRSTVFALCGELAAEGRSPDVVINNAGKALGLELAHEADLDDWDEMVETNVQGLLYVARAFLPHMVEQNRGHLVNVGSIAGLWSYPRGNAYCGTKFAVRGISEGINMDLAGTRVRVSSVDPGLVETEFSEVRFHGDTERAEKVYEGYKPLTGRDVADVIAYVVNAPEHVDIFNVVLMPTDQRHSMILSRES